MALQTFAPGQTLTASNMNTLQASDYNYARKVVTSATYTVLLEDRGQLLEFQNAGGTTVTIPLNSSIAFNIGDVLEIINGSTAAISIIGASGVTIESTGNVTSMTSQWQKATLVKRETNNWVLTGITTVAILDSVITDDDISASAAIAHSKLANITAGQVLLGNASNVPTATALSGDVTINSSGVTAIGSGVIVNADINASAAISYSKLNINNSISTTDLATGAPRAGFRSAQNPQSGTTYTIALSDLGGLVELNNESPITLTIPLESSVAFAIGDRVDILQTGAGQVTIAGAGGVTVNAFDGGLKLNGQWAAATLIKRATNTWVAIGNLTT